MATIKSYTDLEQSKKLAEFLPLNSADMFYVAGKGEPIFIGNKMVSCGKDDYDALGEPDVLCWSLAALYNILPNNKKDTTTLSRGGWKIEPVEYLDTWWCEYEDEKSHTNDLSMSADNPVDACVVMVEKLHELNLL